VICLACGAAFRIDFDPPDAPHLRGRITLLREPNRMPNPNKAETDDSGHLDD
jgi:hypothetical protein